MQWGMVTALALLLGLLAVVPTLLQQRDTAVLLAHRKPPAPSHGAIRTISLGPVRRTASCN